MPYIIITSHRTMLGKFSAMDAERSRRAVATLDEAREAAFIVITDATMQNEYNLDALITTDGGTIGPLPDGTVIEVESTSWQVLAGDPWNHEERRWKRQEEILGAFNA